MGKKTSRRARRVKKKAERENLIKNQRERFKKRQRNKKILNYSILIILVAAVVYAVYISIDTDVAQHDDLARCLTDAGVVMYGTDWCPHCQDQKRLFGKSFQYVNYVNCDLNADACDLAGVQGYPTWTFPSGDSVSGVQELEYLAERAGCSDGA